MIKILKRISSRWFETLTGFLQAFWNWIDFQLNWNPRKRWCASYNKSTSLTISSIQLIRKWLANWKRLQRKFGAHFILVLRFVKLCWTSLIVKMTRFWNHLDLLNINHSLFRKSQIENHEEDSKLGIDWNQTKELDSVSLTNIWCNLFRMEYFYAYWSNFQLFNVWNH